MLTAFRNPLLIISILGVIVLGTSFYITSNNYPPRFSNIQHLPSSSCAPDFISQVNCLGNRTVGSNKTAIGIASTQPPTEQHQQQQANDAFNMGIILAESGNIREAIKYYDKALVVLPINADLLMAKGDALSQVGDYDNAIKYYDKALAVQPNGRSSNDILSHKANDLYRLGRYSQAIENYDNALAVQPSDPDLLINKGNALFHTSNFSGAIKYYDKALAVLPEGSSNNSNSSRSTIINKALALFYLGNYSGAIKYYDKALTLAPKDVHAREGRMQALRALNENTNSSAK